MEVKGVDKDISADVEGEEEVQYDGDEIRRYFRIDY